jgi:hypothetical protein
MFYATVKEPVVFILFPCRVHILLFSSIVSHVTVKLPPLYSIEGVGLV